MRRLITNVLLCLLLLAALVAGFLAVPWLMAFWLLLNVALVGCGYLAHPRNPKDHIIV